MEEMNRKTGATPIPVGDLGGGRIVAATEVKSYAVAFIDGHGEKFVRYVDVLASGEVYIRAEDKTVAPAQKWFREALKVAVAEKDNSVSKVVDSTAEVTKPEQF